MIKVFHSLSADGPMAKTSAFHFKAELRNASKALLSKQADYLGSNPSLRISKMNKRFCGVIEIYAVYPVIFLNIFSKGDNKDLK